MVFAAEIFLVLFLVLPQQRTIGSIYDVRGVCLGAFAFVACTTLYKEDLARNIAGLRHDHSHLEDLLTEELARTESRLMKEMIILKEDIAVSKQDRATRGASNT